MKKICVAVEDRKKVKTPFPLPLSIGIMAKKLLDILDEAEMSLDDFMVDEENFRLYLKRDFPELAEGLGWAWITQLQEKTPCPRSRKWQVEDRGEMIADLNCNAT